MRKVSLIVHQDYVDTVIKTLHEAGKVEIIDISKESPKTLEEAEKAEMNPEAGTCTNYELRLSRLSDILSKTKKSPSGIKSMLNPELPEIIIVEDRSLDELYSYAEGILSEIEKNILSYEETLSKLDEQKEKINIEIEQVSFLKDFNLDISDIGESNYLIIAAGKTSELPSIEKEIKPLETVELYSKQVATGKNPEWAVVIVSHISEQGKIEKLCREKISLFDFQHLSGAPKQVIKTLEQQKTKIGDEKKQINAKLKKYASQNLHELLALKEEIKLERVRKEVSKNFAKTGSTFIINGWVLEKYEDEVKSLAISASNDHIIYSSATPSLNPDNPPTYFETPKWANIFKSLLEMFATPKYNEINPMIIMGIFFVLFFGIMLGDAGYGLTILFLSVFGYIKFSKHSEMIKNWSFMGIWLGLITIIVGFLTNSFFGDFIPRFIYQNPNQLLYSITIGGINLPVEPLRNPLTILTISLLFGLVHLNLGILLALYQTYRNREYKEFITNHFSWILLQIGGGLLIGDLLLHLVSLGTIEFYISSILVVTGIILRLIHAGPLGFFDVTGFVGDWLSYARLLALGLATSGMALAFNIVAKLFADMMPIEIIGIIIMVFLLVLLHVINLGLQALGAGVHSLRLQYVEFFNRFYEGGGHQFRPFSIKRRYTKIEGVNK